MCSSLRISGHLPAAIVNGGGDRISKWKEFKLSRARDLDLDLGSGHTAYRRASLIDIYLYTKFHSNRRNFLWTDGRTYGLKDVRTDIFPPSNIIRSTFGSRPKKPRLRDRTDRAWFIRLLRHPATARKRSKSTLTTLELAQDTKRREKNFQNRIKNQI